MTTQFGTPYNGTLITMPLGTKSTFLLPRFCAGETYPLTKDIIKYLDEAAISLPVKGIFVVYTSFGEPVDPRARVIVEKGERIQVRWFPLGTSIQELEKERPPPFDMRFFHSEKIGQSYKMDQLKNFCKERKLKTTGNKVQLLQRLRDYELM